ncbi:hypothetical protein FACS189421_05810 [Bacteroidia bacterium]|nr:hypothetical protein FACS189421_05810 [Bacteroidia bacterium]GHT02676.1 hypothetical protein FACS189423_01860 [Bacteroidia bacterium]GHT45779.1 hypothetical protein FACS189440_02450 [Bacteroidia bacterium]
METFFLYLIKSAICLALFYIGYKLLLSKETFFRFNRFVLLIGISLCAILPLISFPITAKMPFHQPIAEIENFIWRNQQKLPDEVLPEIFNKELSETLVPEQQTVVSRVVEQAGNSHFSFIRSIGLLYGMGCCMAFITLIISIIKMISLLRSGKKINLGKETIVIVKEKIVPFSFGKLIALSESDYQQNFSAILTHEKVHIRKNHSLDLLFAEVFIILQWFNPAMWLLKREMKNIHEYEVDQNVIQSGIDAIQYQLLLIQKAVGGKSYALANSFNHSKIKNRITMMLKKKSTHGARLKTLLFVPLAAVGLLAFAHPEITRNEEKSLNSESANLIQQETPQATENVEDTANIKQQKAPVVMFPPPIIHWYMEASSVTEEKREVAVYQPKKDTKKYVIVDIEINHDKTENGKIFPNWISNGTTVKTDTIVYHDYLNTQSFIVMNGDTLELIQPIQDKYKNYIKMTSKYKEMKVKNGGGPILQIIHRRDQ